MSDGWNVRWQKLLLTLDFAVQNPSSTGYVYICLQIGIIETIVNLVLVSMPVLPSRKRDFLVIIKDVTFCDNSITYCCILDQYRSFFRVYLMLRMSYILALTCISPLLYKYKLVCDTCETKSLETNYLPMKPVITSVGGDSVTIVVSLSPLSNCFTSPRVDNKATDSQSYFDWSTQNGLVVTRGTVVTPYKRTGPSW